MLTTTRFRTFDVARPHELALTYWFDAAGGPGPSDASVTAPGTDAPGTRLRVRARRRADADQPEEFADADQAAGRRQVDVAYDLGADAVGAGLTAWTIRVPDVAAGVWDVTLTPDGAAPSWRATTTGRTMFAPLARGLAPGARLGAWPMLVAVGATLGLWSQHLLARRAGLDATTLTLLSLLAVAVGAVGAKSYYLLTHPDERRSVLTSGMSVQGFVLGTMVSLGATGLAFGLPLGDVADASTPGLLAGLALGRLGCLLGGCCVGRPTRSRWGVWSSDRTVGTRRIPVQIVDAAAAAGLTAVASALVLARGASGGLIFVASMAAWVLMRQLVFPLRAIPRLTRSGRPLVQWLAVLVVLASGSAMAFGW